MPIIDTLRKLRRPRLQNLNSIGLYEHIFLENLAHVQRHKPNDAIFPVVKSNAYGHGLKQVAQMLRATSVPYICVDSFPEYQIVKKYARKPSLVIWETLPSNYRYYDPKRATIAVYNMSTLRTLIQLGRRQRIHLFLNTGMNREGLQRQQLPDVISLLYNHPYLELEGVMSHLSDADHPSPVQLQKQQDQCAKMIQQIRARGIHPKYIHIGNSAGRAKINDPYYNAWRVGIALYGYSPLEPDDPDQKAHEVLAACKPRLQLRSHIISCQQIKQDDYVGYRNTFQAPHNGLICTIPLWYNEGLMRHIQPHLHIKRKNTYIPCAGRVSMNLSSYYRTSTTEHDNAPRIYDEVIVYDHHPEAPNAIAKLAQQLDTIPYELLVKLDPTIHRRIIPAT